MPLTRRRLGEEDGWVLPAALGLLAAMLALGLALLTVVDSQTQAAGIQPKRDAALNLAETALSGSAFALSRSWPTYRDANVPWTATADCSTQALSGPGRGTAPTSAGAFPTNVQQVVDQAWGTRPDAPTARWSLHVCDDTGAGGARSTIWSDGGLANPAYDSNGSEAVAADATASPPQPAYKRRRMWVRAQATVSGRSRAVAGLVQVVEQPALPTGYATIAGKLSYAAGTGTMVRSLLTGGAAGQLVQGILGNGSSTGIVQGGYIGQRCGLLDLCVSSAVGSISDIPLVSSTGVVSSQVKQFGAATAAGSAAIDRLRQQAVQSGRYVASVPAGGSCFASSGAGGDGSITFIEQVAGDGICTVPSTGSIGTLVVARGRVDVTAPGIVKGVVYAGDGQGASSDWVVHIKRGTTVQGGVYVDGGGMLSIDQPAISVSRLLDEQLCNRQSPLYLGYAGCVTAALVRLLGADDAITSLLGFVAPGTLVAALLPQLTGDPPAVVLDPTQTSQVVTYGTAGTVQQSFREVAPRAGG